jgi:hypothetical protein
MRSKRPKDSELIEVPTADRVVRIWLSDGSVGYEDADGESTWDGWATVDDLVWGLGKHAGLPPDEARSVAEEAVQRWVAPLGPGHVFRHYRQV